MAKKLSPLVWVLIGCGGLVLIGVIGLGIFGFWAKSKLTEFSEEASKNPAMILAKGYAMANPDVEITGSDDENQTVTFRDKKSGKEVTLNLEQIKEGKFSFETEEGTTTFSSDEKSLTINGPQGQSTTWGENAELPTWVPTYPNTKPVGVASVNDDKQMGGMFSMETTDTAEAVVDWYKTKFSEGGYTEKSVTSASSETGTMRSLTARNDQTNQNITLTVTTSDANSGTIIQVTYHSDKP